MTPCFRRVNHLSNTLRCPPPPPPQPTIYYKFYERMHDCVLIVLCMLCFFMLCYRLIGVLVVLTTCKIPPRRFWAKWFLWRGAPPCIVVRWLLSYCELLYCWLLYCRILYCRILYCCFLYYGVPVLRCSVLQNLWCIFVL